MVQYQREIETNHCLKGVHQTVGLMGKSGANIEFAMKLLIQKSLANQLLTDFQFVPLPWDEGKRLSDRKLKIGW